MLLKTIPSVKLKKDPVNKELQCELSGLQMIPVVEIPACKVDQ